MHTTARWQLGRSGLVGLTNLHRVWLAWDGSGVAMHALGMPGGFGGLRGVLVRLCGLGWALEALYDSDGSCGPISLHGWIWLDVLVRSVAGWVELPEGGGHLCEGLFGLKFCTFLSIKLETQPINLFPLN